jgi:hypothetical protein
MFKDSDGKLRSKASGRNLEEGKAERARILVKKAEGTRVAPPTKITFEEYGRTWLSTLIVRQSTIGLYRQHFEKHLVPAFGRKRLADITDDDVRSLIADLTRKKRSPYTIRAVLVPLTKILSRAEDAELIRASPMRKLKTSDRPAASNGERRSLNSDDTKKLLAAAGKHRALIAVGSYTGLRLAEVLGLTWEDIDFESGFVHVRKQLGRDRQANGSQDRPLAPGRRADPRPRDDPQDASDREPVQGADRLRVRWTGEEGTRSPLDQSRRAAHRCEGESRGRHLPHAAPLVRDAADLRAEAGRRIRESSVGACEQRDHAQGVLARVGQRAQHRPTARRAVRALRERRRGRELTFGLTSRSVVQGGREAFSPKLAYRLGFRRRGAWRSLVSALVWGTRGPEFESRRPD